MEPWTSLAPVHDPLMEFQGKEGNKVWEKGHCVPGQEDWSSPGYFNKRQRGLGNYPIILAPSAASTN